MRAKWMFCCPRVKQSTGLSQDKLKDARCQGRGDRGQGTGAGTGWDICNGMF